jgi:excisionase family DNA binding protein
MSNDQNISSNTSKGQPQSLLAALINLVTTIVEASVELDSRASNKLGDHLLTLPQVAHYLQVSERTVETLVAEGELQPIYIRSRRRFEPEAVKAYLRSQANGNASKRR